MIGRSMIIIFKCERERMNQIKEDLVESEE